jgi:hypothetical protein
MSRHSHRYTKEGSMRTLLLTAVLLGACSSHEFRCDKHLSAINAPTPGSAVAWSPDPGPSGARLRRTPEQAP